MNHEKVARKAHGDAGVYRVWDDERSVELYIDYISGNAHIHTALSERDDELIDMQLEQMEDGESNNWLDRAEAYLEEEIL